MATTPNAFSEYLNEREAALRLELRKSIDRLRDELLELTCDADMEIRRLVDENFRTTRHKIQQGLRQVREVQMGNLNTQQEQVSCRSIEWIGSNFHDLRGDLKRGTK